MSSKERICVVGLGQFGREAAKALAKTGCEVLAIDVNQKLVNELSEHVQRSLRLDARVYDDLASVVDKSFDQAIVSMGENLEASILAVLHLRKIGIDHIHAKAVNEDHATILRSLGATNIVFPETEAAQRLTRRILNPNMLENFELSEGYMLAEIAPPDQFCGETLGNLHIRRKYGVFVIAVHERLPERTVFMPGPEFLCKPSDTLIMLGKVADIESINNLVSK